MTVKFKMAGKQISTKSNGRFVIKSVKSTQRKKK